MSTHKLLVPEPRIEDRPTSFNQPLLCGPGPANIWPSVHEALTRPILSPNCDELFNVMDDIRSGIQYLFQTRSKLVLAMSGSGHTGMEALITNLLAPHETLLVASRGIWDERAYSVALRHGSKAEAIKISYNETFSLSQIEPVLKKIRPAALFITHGDSSNGTYQRLEGLGELCHKYGALLLVDTVVSLGAVPFLMDEWKVDGVYTSTQKALSGPAGISPIAFSERAQEKIFKRTHETVPFYYDMKMLAEQWNCFGNTRKYHHTLSPPLLWALRRCIQEVSSETLPKSWARHSDTIEYFHKRLHDLGFQHLIPKKEDRLATVTTVVLPKGYDYAAFAKCMKQKHNIVIFQGLGPTVGKTLRIGIMGVNSTRKVADTVAEAMADCLRTLTKSSL